MLVSKHEEIAKVVERLQEKFGGDEKAAADLGILIEAYTELAKVCRDVGETKEADRYEAKIKMLEQRAKELEKKKLPTI